MEAAPSPFGKGKHLLRVAVKAREVPPQARKVAHLVFLVDVSGSMDGPDRIELAKQSLRILVENLQAHDTVALVTYAGNTRVVLEPTGMDERGKILAAIDDLDAGGSTAMESGLDLAYRLAVRSVRRDQVSRVIVLSDGDANVGNTTHDEILRTIRRYVDEGVTLSTVGFGMGNYRDNLMEQLADRGNGNYAYVDTPGEARRIFGDEIGGTIEVVAQDAKIQVEFDPAAVARYRLVGYENRDVADEDFRDDRVDAGEIGAGHTVSAMYEVELRRGGPEGIATVRIRAEPPGGGEALEHAYPFRADRMRAAFEAASTDFRFASAVTGFAEILRHSEHARDWRMDDVRRVARGATPEGDAQREEFVALLGEIRPR
jgi:Ca-activated chloride channel family protein